MTLKQTKKSKIIANKDVWLEGEAIQQLDATASMHDCTYAVGMPDLHPGPGIPIGAAFAFSKSIHPRLVGSDAGCGAIFIGLHKVKANNKLASRVREEFSTDFIADSDKEAICLSAWHKGPVGLLEHSVPSIVRSIVDRIGGDSMCESAELDYPLFGHALGSIGGGNHFAEITQVQSISEKEEATKLGLTKGSLGVLCHSGSRGLGKALSDRWGHTEIPQEQASAYLAELAGAIRFARVNRVLLAWRLLRAMGVSRLSKLACAFDSIHNDVKQEHFNNATQWIHRKGCAPAPLHTLAVVLGSRETPTWIMKGLGNPMGLHSVAHGAGRKMKRSEAREKIRLRYRKKELQNAPMGRGMVICDNNKLLYEEHPDAYKDIEPVIQSLEEEKMASRVLSLQPLITVKK